MRLRRMCFLLFCIAQNSQLLPEVFGDLKAPFCLTKRCKATAGATGYYPYYVVGVKVKFGMVRKMKGVERLKIGVYK